MDRQAEREDEDRSEGDLYSEDGDAEPRTALNLAGLSLGSGDDVEHDDDEDRDSQGRLRLSMMSMPDLSDSDGADGESRGVRFLTAGGDAELMQLDQSRPDDESGSEDGGDLNLEELRVGDKECAHTIDRDDSSAGVALESPGAVDAHENADSPDSPAQCGLPGAVDNELSDEKKPSKLNRSEDAAGDGKRHRVSVYIAEDSEPHYDRLEHQSDWSEAKTRRNVQVKPTPSLRSAAATMESMDELRSAQPSSDDSKLRYRAPPGEAAGIDTPPTATDPTAQLAARLASNASVQHAPAPPEADSHLDDVAVSPLPPEPHPAPSYTIRDLFPVVYESSAIRVTKTTNRVAGAAVKPHEHRSPSRRATLSISSATKPPRSSTTERTAHPAVPQQEQQRIQSLHKQLEIAQGQLKSATQSIKNHHIADAEQRQLQQRNVRIRQQLDALTADLQRTKAENAKLQAENELFAAKLPHLQAELLQESCQADEKQAQAVQMQLSVTQLKARVHVLQTRNTSLGTQTDKMQLELRESRKELRRKTAALLATTEKLTKLEAETSSSKSVHAQELLQWKTRLSAVTQRFELERVKLASDLGRRTERQLSEAKAQAASATKRKRELEVLVAKLEDELKLSKREADSSKQELHTQVKATLALESLLKKAHRVEATLRNEVAVFKAKLRVCVDEQKKQATWEANRARRSHRSDGGNQPAHHNPRRRLDDKLLYPLDLLLLEVGLDSEDESFGSGEDDGSRRKDQHCKCCALLGSPASSPKQHELKRTSPPREISRSDRLLTVPSCQECSRARDELQSANDEIHRLRVMHATELKVQASAFNQLLRIGSRGIGGAAANLESTRSNKHGGLEIFDGASTIA